jgi:hypothetical protein
LLRPKGRATGGPLLVYVKRPGDSIYAMDLDELLPVLGRQTVLILDPRFTEASLAAEQYTDIERTSAWTGRTVAAMQVWDILRAVEWAEAEEKLAPGSVAIYGKGDIGILGLCAGFFDRRIGEVILNDPPDSHWSHPAPLDILRVTDISEIAGLFAPRRLVSLTEYPKSFDLTREIYRLSGGQMSRAPSLPEALEIWKN